MAKINWADNQDFSERELLSLELIQDFGPITEKALCKIFGLSFSSIGELVGMLIKKGLIDESEKTRGKPLELTEAGKSTLEKLKEKSAIRYGYFFESSEPMTDDEWKLLMKLFEKVDRNAERFIQESVFGR